MTTYVDTNVIIDLMKPQSKHHAWSLGKFERAKALGPVLVSDAVYSEFSVTMDTQQDADRVLQALAFVRCGYTDAALFLAGKAYAMYRGNSGTKLNVLPDFFIGALAETEKVPLLTRDPKRMRTYFPSISLICPEEK